MKFFCANGENQSWQVWVSLKGNTKIAESNIAKFKRVEFKMAVIIKLAENDMSLCQIELVWFRVRVERECFWVNLREDNKVSESKMAVTESNMAEFKMAAIIKLSQNEWVKILVQMVGTNLGKYEWVSKEILRWLNPRWPNARWQNSGWLLSSSKGRLNDFESDWISLSQSQSGVRVFLSESERR